MYKKGTMVLLLVVLSAVYVFQCAKGPPTDNPLGNYVNQAPDTFISQKSLQKVAIGTDPDTGDPTNVNTFNFSITFHGTDIDGTVDTFTYSIDGGVKAGTIKRDFSGTLELLTASDVHTFEVYGTDNLGKDDSSPAKAIFSLEEIAVNKAPTTTIESGPANGSLTGAGVKLGVSGGDDDGIVTLFRYRVDGGSEIEVAADSEGKAVIDFGIANNNTLSVGAHSVSVAAVDNFGAVDETPAAVSFKVEAGFSPILTFTSGPADGGGWFADAAAAIGFEVVMGHYGGSIDGFSWSFDGGSFSSFSTETNVIIPGSDVTSGSHVFIVRARDTGGAVTEGSVSFEAAAATFALDLVLIDDNNFGENLNRSEHKALYAGAGFPGATYWDVGDDHDDDSEVDGTGSAIWSPGILGQYKTIVIWTDASPTAAFNEAILGAYVQAGGNIILTSYAWDDFSGSFLSNTMGVRQIFSSSTGNHVGVDEAWAATRNTGWSPNVDFSLAGTAFRNSSTGSAWLLRAENEDNVFAIMTGGEGASNLAFPRGVFKDGVLPEGNTVSIGHSFRRIRGSDPDPQPFITALMALISKDQ